MLDEVHKLALFCGGEHEQASCFALAQHSQQLWLRAWMQVMLLHDSCRPGKDVIDLKVSACLNSMMSVSSLSLCLKSTSSYVVNLMVIPPW